ncbi:hypothetical protein ORJ04_02055 [Rheinheimera baltica]|uniref:ABC-three component systems C-terminal domain-containing protein n=1 Tax=Rheinheimera baltica TaxID=67576 RepID=A0ABT9HUC9_9GAMM|nr:ABC-three component system protein [Rheinheimera baltica]MDP5134732.1 hypothetical protein [Rheinheimera baltica]
MDNNNELKSGDNTEQTGITDNSVILTDSEISNVDTAGGAFVVGHYHAPNPTKIEQLILAGKALAENSPEYLDLIEDLNSYHKPRPGRPIIGLEKKLTNAKMDVLVEDATYLKGRAIKKIARYQLQNYKAALNNYIYGKINEIFNSEILPLIKAGASPHQVNQYISTIIIKPLADEVCPADPTINDDTIRGMLYILTGNCHLTWS